MNEEIKRIRMAASLSQEEFAKRLGVSFATVNRWENRKAHPSIIAVKHIIDFCKNNSIIFDLQVFLEDMDD